MTDKQESSDKEERKPCQPSKGGKKPKPAQQEGKVPDGQLEKKEQKQEKKARDQEVWVGVGRREGNV
ncbi:hypothetical protein Y1Q_0006628 [Alligator mississippiensis]|uniref:Uncharacterized protein n=1 Tax=Alligator mississippiensis TaxID=8496 RepID=A0A151LY80_ALLMI|nr:hypothetical protein Y1Q_0006628 [Alligator mississippiensis]